MQKMADSCGPKLSLKVAINRQKSKVVFAEANSHFVDVLLSFLTLPLGKIVRIFEGHYKTEAPVVGSITSLYRGLSNLDVSHFCVEGGKKMLLNPRSWLETEFRGLKLDVSGSQCEEYFVCVDSRCPDNKERKISMYCDIATCPCGKPLKKGIFSGDDDDGDGDSEAGVFIVNDSSFIISDDLRILPVSAGLLQTLASLGIADADVAEFRSLSFDINDIMKLLELSITSITPLTDLIIKDRKSSSIDRLPIFPDHIIREVSTARQIILQVSLQKSTNKFLFALGRNDFLELLFSFLTLPLSGVELLFEGKTTLRVVGNLYRSITDLIDSKYFRSSDTRNCLINPKLAYGYASLNRLLPLDEATPPLLYFQLLWSKRSKRWYYDHYEYFYHKDRDEDLSSFTWSKGLEKFVKEQKMCIVSDDLSLTPFSMEASMSILNGLGIPLSDVRETELLVGVEEALSLLKASLTSTTAITDALISPMLNKLPKQPKQEAV